MNTEWWRDLKNDADRAQRVADIKANRHSLDILATILERKLDELDKAQQGKKLYEGPSWAFHQADYIGSKRTIREILDLVTLEKE